MTTADDAYDYVGSDLAAHDRWQLADLRSAHWERNATLGNRSDQDFVATKDRSATSPGADALLHVVPLAGQ